MEDQRQQIPASTAAVSKAEPAACEGDKAIPPSAADRPHAFAENFYAGLRATFFLRSGMEERFGTWAQLLLFLLIGLILQGVSDFLRVGRHGEFTLEGLPDAMFGLPAMMLAACAAAYLARRPQSTLPLMVLFSSIAMLFAFGGLLAPWASASVGDRALAANWHVEGQLAAAAWFALACALAAARLHQTTRYRRALAFMAVGVCVAAPALLAFREPALWVPIADQSAEAGQGAYSGRLETEDVFYLQPRLLERELAALKPSRGERIALYLVAAAGDAEQDVFMREVFYVRDLFKRRFGAEGHSVVLVNHPDTADTSPIASATSLRMALRKVGATMDRDKDILFLFLTSHGSKDHKFALSFGAMQFNDLGPRTLRRMLDEAAIKRRVIVISACYSGGFIDALKSDESVVITSAASDRTSFGCSNEADFTYFGKAYFEDALQHSDSFIDAFEAAKPLIAAREKSEHYDPSNPQIFIGAHAKRWIDQFARERTLAKAGNML